MGSAQGQVPSEVEQARTALEFGAHTALSEKLLAVAIRAQNFTGSTGVAIALAEGDQMVCRANWGTSAPEVGATLSLGNSFTGLCVRSGEPLRCDDAQSDPRVDPEACQALGISAIAAAPVRRGLKVIGVIAAFSDTPNAFTDKQLLILTTLADVVELLDDPHPAQSLPQVIEAPAPELARAEAVVQASILPLVDKASVPTTVLQAPPAPVAKEDLIVVPIAPATLAQSEPPRDAPPSSAAEAAPDAAQPSQPESAIPTVIANSRPPAAPPSSKPAVRETPRGRGEAFPKKDEVLPAAMDQGPPPQPAKTAITGTAGPARLTLIMPPQPTPAPTPTPTPAPVPDFVADLRFSGVEADAGSDRRWLLPVAILVIFAILAFAIEQWNVAKSASKAQPVPTVQAPEPQAAPAAPSELTPQEKPPEPTLAEPKHSPFSPPPIKEAVPNR